MIVDDMSIFIEEDLLIKDEADVSTNDSS
jgi:hypothetical protein